jgi:pimeloyl-ACP methyl ester carboxylesterase
VRLAIRLLLLVVTGLVFGVGILFYFAQRRLLYFPTVEEHEAAVRSAHDQGLDRWLGQAGQFLGWKAPCPRQPAMGKLLVLHGNAGTAAERVYLRDAFQGHNFPLALDVYLLEYPGYGSRSGSPTEQTLVAAAREAVDLLHLDGSGPLLVVGESIGSGVAALVAAERPGSVSGLILVTPLLSIPAVARRHLPFLPTLLIRDTYRADESLRQYGGPVAFLLAGRDSVVFADLGEELFRSYRGPKHLWLDPDADHNTLDYEPTAIRWAEMLVFLVDHPVPRSPGAK